MESSDVANAFTRMLHALDAGDWAGVRREFADQIDMDYSSLFGTPPERVQGDAQVVVWQAFASAFDATQHVTGPFVVTIDDDQATAETHVRAYHQITGATGGEIWMVAGHYQVRLHLIGGRWKISGIKLTVFYQEGNRSILEAALARAADPSRVDAQPPR
jgi:SnoaL-like protein